MHVGQNGQAGEYNAHREIGENLILRKLIFLFLGRR